MGSVPDGRLRAVADSDLNPKVFNVERNSDGVWLNTNYVNPENRYALGTVWVWSRRPPAAILFISPRPPVPGSFVWIPVLA